MKNRGKQQSGKGILRRFLAKTLALTMVLSFLTPAAPMTAYASELAPEPIGDTGASEATAFKWVMSNRGEYECNDIKLETLQFDLVGLKAGQTEYSTDGIQTTYNHSGYATWIMTPKDEGTTEVPKAGFSSYSDRFDYMKPSPEHNGAVITNAALGIEYKMTAKPDPSKHYIFVDYYLRDTTGKGGTKGRTFYVGTGADTKIGDDDRAICYKNSKGFHMVNRSSKETFDCITDDPELGVTKPDKRYVGPYSPYWEYMFTGNDSTQSSEGTDSGIAWSWKIHLRPYEIVHKRVAFLIKATSYYVSDQYGEDSSSHDGTCQNPYKTIGYALDQLSGRKGYIYVMDYPELQAEIPVSGGESQDITISGTDYNHEGEPVTSSISLKRASGFTGSLFNQTGSGKLKFTNITLDGNQVESSEPILSASNGTLELNSGAKVTGAKGTGTEKGSAVDLSGSAALSMNGGSITGNESKEGGKGAVYYNSSGTFQVLNKVNITDNKDHSGTPANVYLPDGKTITVVDDLKDGKIGVTSATLPVTMSGSAPTEASQEITVAKPAAGPKEKYPGYDQLTSCPFSDNIVADLKEKKGIEASEGVLNNDARKCVVFRRKSYSIAWVYVDDQGADVVGAQPSTERHGVGDSVTKPAESFHGYTLEKVEVSQGAYSSLKLEQSGADKGKVTGTMPAGDVVITYTYVKQYGSIAFQSNGGSPEPSEIKGKIGDPVNAILPTVSKLGYLFRGWAPGTYDANSKSFTPPVKQAGTGDYDIKDSLPATFPEHPEKYYAIFQPDPGVTFDCKVAYQNHDGSIVFRSKDEDKVHGSVETPLSFTAKPIHGYKWSLGYSRRVPDQFDFGNGNKAFGNFDQQSGTFTGKMPGQNASVIYRYEVDRGDENAVSPLTVRYVTGSSGNEREVLTASQQGLYPEDSISVSPANVFGYDLESWKLTKGTPADDTDGHLVSQVTGSFDDAGNYTGKMPNQPVEITYTYKPNGEGYRFQVRYEDTESQDSLLKEISSVTEKHPADANVQATYALPYGYRYAEQKAEPQAPEAQFDGAHNYTARMPADDLTVTYRHRRDSSQWATIHYDGGLYGALSHDNERPSDDPNKKVSPDVIKDRNGGYLTDVLKADNQGHGDTWAAIKKKRLVPLVSLDSTNSESQYYRFAGWFIDADGDGVWDKNDGEKLISEDQTFAEDTTLTAAFEEDPDKWVDVQLTAGDHGTLIDNNTGALISTPVTIHTRYDSKWEDILPPNNKPEVNYLVRGWYDGARKIEDHDSLRNGATYTLQFYPDPLVFGTNAGDVDAAGSLDEDGKGRVTAFDTKPGYRYFITDLDGTILDVQDGSVTGRTVFDKRCPGTRYLVYEAEGSSDAAPGMKAAEVRGAHGHPSEVLTPVVERNYQITYDTKHEDKTVLTIEPADRDADYALLDQEGHVVHTQESGADGWQTPVKKPGRVAFSGLDYNGVYTVVARPKGKSSVTAESKRPDGTELTMDPGGELEIPKFIVKTVNGTVKTVGEHTVNGEEYEEAHRGDSVRVSAEAENDAGQRFRAWRVLVGAVSGLGAKLKALVFDFTMPDTNVVFSAEYERSRQSSPSNARVTDEVRGGNPGEMALDPKEVSGLEESLTTPKDRELMDVNHADVTYKVVYQKGRVKATVSNALRKSEFYTGNSHKSAYTEAWDLGVLIERYVNGRRVGRTTPSDAAFNTYVQLDREDVDMMDYALYEYRKDPQEPTGYEVIPVDMVGEPEKDGGLFQFTARPDAHYVLTYSKAYHLTFLNEHSQSQPKYDFKVRKGEAPSDSTYETDYEKLEQPEPHVTDDQGIEYQYQDWSRRRDKLRVFDADQPIQKRTYVYAYYKDNGPEVRNTRKQLDDAIREAARRADDFFLKRKETGEILDAVKEALAVFEKKAPAATAPELQKALDKLKRSMEPYDRTLDKRYDHYGRINTERNVGGSSGGGGGRGAGVQASPFVPESPKSYVVGTNGSWELLNAEKQEWAFVLNGGIRLVSRWGKLDYANGDVNRNGWYHFNAHGIMDSGWFLDEAGSWYYCNTAHDGWFGKMKTGWHYDRDDSRWYYLDPVTGRMATGWVQIDGKWYYFAPHNEGSTWAYDGAAEKWFYLDNKRRPFGSLYQNETTPDQYRVDGNGAWVK